VKFWKGFNWLRLKSMGRYTEHGNEPSDSIKYGEFLDRLMDYHPKYIYTLSAADLLVTPSFLRPVERRIRSQPINSSTYSS
jgi:hypothetical protein